MNKIEFIARYGEGAYIALKARNLKSTKKYQLANPNKVTENHRVTSHKGGKRYAKKQKYKQFGVQGDRNKIRSRDSGKWRPFKKIIAPDSQLHHEWLPGSAKYTGLALVDAEQHIHGYIEVIKIFEGTITLLTEEDIKNRDITYERTRT